MDTDLSSTLEIIQGIAKEAGLQSLQYMSQNKQIEHKSAVNLVTIADKNIEKFICKELIKHFPNHGIVAEEGYQHKPSNNYYWMVDPIDGTTSFVHNFPMFAVSIGLSTQQHTPILGVVYNPFYDEMFYAIRNKGAFLNDKQISVSKVTSVREALIGTGFPYDRQNKLREVLDRLHRVLLHTHDIRRTGSSAIDVCYVASGRLDGYYEQGLQPWDMAASSIIASEAGATITLYDEKPFDLYKQEILVTNGKIHAQLSEILLARL